MFILLCYAIIVQTFQAEATADCPVQWSNIEGSCFVHVTVPATWVNAIKYCSAFGGKLASLQTKAKNLAAIDYLVKKGETSSVWLSGNDMLEEGVWKWAATQEDLTYNYWGPNSTDNLNDQDCMVLDMQKHMWADRDCTSVKYNYLCERSLIEKS